MRVLVVEDERSIADAIARGLRRAGMAVDVAYDGTSGHEMAFVTRYDVLVLDRDLPGIHGDDICADLAAAGTLTRVLMLTASGSVADRVEGLGLGADDYLPKPFAWDELLARVRALGRRSSPVAPPVLTVADVELDPAKRTVTRADVPLDLGRKEFGLLEELLKARGAAVSTEELLERVWDANTDPFTTIVRVTMMTLRKKLGDPPLIETVVGVGYRIATDRPATDRAGGDRAGADRATDRGGADRAGADRATDRAGVDRAGADRDAVDRVGAGRAGAERVGTTRTGTVPTATDRATTDRTTTEY